MHAIKGFNVLVKLSNVSTFARLLPFLFNHVNKNFFKQCSSLCYGAVEFAFIYICLCAFSDIPNIISVDCAYRGGHNLQSGPSIYNGIYPSADTKLMATKIQFPIDQFNSAVNYLFMLSRNFIRIETPQCIGKLLKRE